MQPVWRTTLRMIDERQIHTCMFCMISSSTLIFIKMMLFLYPNNKYAFMWYFKEWICAEKYTLKDMMCKYVIRPNNQIIRLNKQPVVRKKNQFSHSISQYWNTILFINVVPFFAVVNRVVGVSGLGLFPLSSPPVLFLTFDFFCILLYFLRLSVVFCFKVFLIYILMNVSSFWNIFLLSFQSQYEVTQFLHHSPCPFRCFFFSLLPLKSYSVWYKNIF